MAAREESEERSCPTVDEAPSGREEATRGRILMLPLQFRLRSPVGDTFEMRPQQGRT